MSAGTGIDLPAGLALDIGVGHADLSRALGESSDHVELVLSGSFDALFWQLAVHATGSNAKKMFYESVVGPRVALSVTYTIWSKACLKDCAKRRPKSGDG